MAPPCDRNVYALGVTSNEFDAVPLLRKSLPGTVPEPEDAICRVPLALFAFVVKAEAS